MEFRDFNIVLWLNSIIKFNSNLEKEFEPVFDVGTSWYLIIGNKILFPLLYLAFLPHLKEVALIRLTSIYENWKLKKGKIK